MVQNSGRGRPSPVHGAVDGAPDGSRGLAELLARAAQGDAEAFADVYARTRRRVHGVALRVLREPGAAEEAALDTYVTVWRRAGSYDPGRGEPLTWMLTIARSKAIDRLRARTRRGRGRSDLDLDTALGRLASADPGPSPETASVRAERGVAVRRALERLPRSQRDAIERAYFGGLSHSEVARALGEPLGTVKSRIRVGLTSLRRTLRESAP